MSAVRKVQVQPLIQLMSSLIESLDPDALDDIAEEIGADNKHSLRAHFLHTLAKQQRDAIALMEGL